MWVANRQHCRIAKSPNPKHSPKWAYPKSRQNDLAQPSYRFIDQDIGFMEALFHCSLYMDVAFHDSLFRLGNISFTHKLLREQSSFFTHKTESVLGHICLG